MESYLHRLPELLAFDLQSQAPSQTTSASTPLRPHLGAVLIARGGEPIFKEPYGFANVGYDVLNLVDTKFDLVCTVNLEYTSPWSIRLRMATHSSSPIPCNRRRRDKVNEDQIVDIFPAGLGTIWTPQDIWCSSATIAQFSQPSRTDLAIWLSDRLEWCC